VSGLIKTSHQAKVWHAHGDGCEECRALGPTELEAIVRALAAAPINDGPDTWCRLCGHERGNHAPVCALGRARDWVERNGNG
jgi:hypothetical protein